METKGFFPNANIPELGAYGIRMDFRNSSLSFVIIMGTVELPIVEERIRNYTLQRAFDRISMGPGLTHLRIPKSKIETELHLNDYLKKVCNRNNVDVSINAIVRFFLLILFCL